MLVEAALVLMLASQRVATAGGPPPPLARLETIDFLTNARTSFSVARAGLGTRLPERIERWTGQGDVPGRRDSVGLDECPAFRPLLEELVRLPLPAPALISSDRLEGRPPERASWFELSGTWRTGTGELGRVTASAFEWRGRAPSPIAQWGRRLSVAFDACLARRATAPTSAEGRHD